MSAPIFLYAIKELSLNHFQIIKWNVKTHESVNCIKGHNGYPFSISISPLTPYQAVIGLGDSNIKIWTFSGEGKSMKKRKKHDFYESKIIWKGLQGQIEHVLWHPKRPDLLAYSTQYGRVGVYDANANKNTVFKTYHKQEYGPNISWGSLSSGTGSEYVLVSCGAEHIIAYDPMEPEKQPVFLAPLLENANPAWTQSINAKANAKRSCMAIDSTGKLIAFGYTDGVVDVYRLDTFKLVFVANCHRHCVLAIAWQSPTKFATGCRHGTVAIHTIPSTGLDNLPDIPLADSSASYVLSGHKKNITALAWSTHKDTPLLASVSVDMIACVWNEQSQKPIAWFREHRGRIFSVCWNILEPNEVFTCGDDRFIFKWKYTDHPFSPKLGSSLAYLGGKLENINHSTLQRYCLTLASKIYGGDPAETVKNVKSQLPSDLLSDQVDSYAKWVPFDDNTENSKAFLLFGGKNDVRLLLEEEDKQAYIKDSENPSTNDTRLWLGTTRGCAQSFGDIGNDFTDNSIADWIALALSPMNGKDAWINLMEKKAKKLAETDHHILAATCYIACSRICEAVEVCRKGSKFREAITIAKARMPQNENVLSTLFSEWGGALQKSDEEILAALW
ncbi:hypothetical protein J3Q64DRAFT_1636761 [Phycomyces blakesleeanus]|uniref:Gem-associated protein 5 TPR domain-containing protein n=1 Tax=Phycomyces blakesleeanus TaxID=4837 RepID=A0ABR3B5U1_PHYBL